VEKMEKKGMQQRKSEERKGAKKDESQKGKSGMEVKRQLEVAGGKMTE
jgi:hypothetical protein